MRMIPPPRIKRREGLSPENPSVFTCPCVGAGVFEGFIELLVPSTAVGIG